MNDRLKTGLRWIAGSMLMTAAGCVLASTNSPADNDGDITTTLTPLPASVTLSTAQLPTYLSYSFTITHYATRSEALAPITLTATTNVVGATGVTADVVASSLPTGCALGTASTTTFSCNFSAGLTAPGSTIAFTVTVKAPTAGTQVTVTSNTSWQEAGDDRRLVTEVEPTRTASTALNAPNPNEVATFVPPSTSATALFTGLGCAPSPLFLGCPATPTQTWTTVVTIPAQPTATTADILQSISPTTCAPNLLTCSATTLTIPGNFSHLTITLRRDASTIAKGAKIANAIVTYSDPAHPNPKVTYPLQVLSCTDTTYGPLPQSGIPCIYSRTAYPRGGEDDDDKPKIAVPPGFAGDWEFVIYALDNGRYQN